LKVYRKLKEYQEALKDGGGYFEWRSATLLAPKESGFVRAA